MEHVFPNRLLKKADIDFGPVSPLSQTFEHAKSRSNFMTELSNLLRLMAFVGVGNDCIWYSHLLGKHFQGFRKFNDTFIITLSFLVLVISFTCL